MKRLYYVISLCCLLFAVSCTNNETQQTSTGSSSTASNAHLIAAHTSNQISRAASIEVRFANPTAVTGDIGNPLSTSPLTLEPAMDGQSYWDDAYTLRFQPVTPLKSGSHYTAKVDLKTWFDDISEEDRYFRFNFSTINRAFEIQVDPLQSASAQDLKNQVLTGRIQSSDYEEPEGIQAMVQAIAQGSALTVSWEHTNDNRTHAFRVSNIERKNNRYQVNLNWDSGRLGGNFKGSKTVEVMPLNVFVVQNIQRLQNPQRIEISFSDPLNPNQDLTGLIHIPGQNVKLSHEGNVATVYPAAGLVGEISLKVERGVENVLGYKISKPVSQTMTFTETKPEVRLVGQGVIVPRSEGVFFPFEAVNLSAVDVRIMKIFQTNIPRFLQEFNFNQGYNLQRMGRTVLKKTVQLDPDKSMNLKQWNRHVLDLSELVETEPGALYQIKINFRHSYSLYSCGAMQGLKPERDEPDPSDEAAYWSYYDKTPWDWRNRENPCHRTYYTDWRGKTRAILSSDLGLIAKRGQDNRIHAYVTDLLNAQPVPAATVTLIDYQLQQVSNGKTNRAGQVIFDVSDMAEDQRSWLIIAQKGPDRGYLTMNDGQALSLSRFDVGGAQLKDGLNGMIYGERGVWRPGDDVHLTLLLHDKTKSLPAEHPVTFELNDSRGSLVHRETTTQGADGFYAFTVKTDPEAPTGSWTARAKVGGAIFTRPVRIETVMPNRLKIDLEVDPLAKGVTSQGKLNVAWLHGAAARNLKTDLKVRLTRSRTSFKTHPDFSFDDPLRNFSGDPLAVFTGKVDESGHATFPIKLPDPGTPPGRLRAAFTSKVFEPGGAFSIDSFSMPYDPYQIYAGVRPPEGDKRGRLLTDQDHNIEITTLDRDGKPVARKGLDVGVYKLQWRWWWDQNANRITQFRDSVLANPVSTGTVDTDANGAAQWDMRINYPEWGRYLIRVCESGGHCTGKVVYVDWPGWAGRNRDADGGAAVLTFSADKDQYDVGEQASLNIPSSEGGRLLVSIESGSHVIRSEWVPTENGSTNYSFKLTEEMAPNVYAHVTLVQPHNQTANDRPIRLYGVIPLMVNNPRTRLQPVLAMDDVLRPQSEFQVMVSEAEGRAMSYTLAVVDEGLLGLTRFNTPNPWNAFYGREALTVKTWDMFGLVLGAMGGQMPTPLAIGGGDRVNTDNDRKANRFEPVVRFLGPYTMEAGQTITHTLDMPLYVGAVRTMVVAGKDGAYGATDKSVPVRKPLMIQGTLPRVLGTGETVQFPLSVFAMEDHVKEVEVSITTNKLLNIEGPDFQKLRFETNGDQLIRFPLSVAQETGVASIQAVARSGKETARFEIELEVRNPNPYVTKVESHVIQGGESFSGPVSAIGMPGTNTQLAEVSTIPDINLSQRLDYLTRYPHGCLEQTTSAAFPQLFLSKLTELNDLQKQQIDDHIKTAINRMSHFQTVSGEFGYWPGSRDVNAWSSNYAGHFLIEARNLGYTIPHGLLDGWISAQRLKANAYNSSNRNDALTQAYRLYLLALGGSPQLGAMNRFRENTNLYEVSRWYLAAAYHLAGQKDYAARLASELKTEIPSYRQLSQTFGSSLRDKAIILDLMRMLGLWERTPVMMQQIADHLKGDKWLSTQETGYALMALARVAGRNAGALDLTHNTSSTAQRLTSSKSMARLTLAENTTSLNITNHGDAPLYLRMVQTGQPLVGDPSSAANDLNIQVAFTDLTGQSIDPARISQGTDFYATVTINHPGVRENYREMALSQIFPSGWEIHNERLATPTDEAGNPTSTPSKAFTYRDIRDDRVMTYFNLKKGGKKTFKVMLNAAYLGRYYMPTTGAEAMYDNSISAHRPGKWVEVVN